MFDCCRGRRKGDDLDKEPPEAVKLTCISCSTDWGSVSGMPVAATCKCARSRSHSQRRSRSALIAQDDRLAASMSGHDTAVKTLEWYRA